jgi:hypothetical protein
MTVYLLRFTEPPAAGGEPLGSERHSARYYVGYTSRRIADRLDEHRNGEGAAITRAVVLRACPRLPGVPAHIEPFTLIWAIDGDRWAERILKGRKRHRDLAAMRPHQVRAYLARKRAEVGA